MSHRTGVHVNLTGNTRKTPEILILAIASIAPAHDLHGHQCLLAWSQESCHVELHLQFAVLAVTYFLTIYPHGQVAGGRTHVQINLLTLPVSRNQELTTIRTRVVVLFLNEGRIVLELGVPGITHILINTISVTIQLEKSRNRKVHPVGIVVSHSLESNGSLVMILDELEFPIAFQAHESGTLLLHSTLSQGVTLIRKEGTAQLLGVHTIGIRIQPTLCFFCSRRNRQHRHRSQREKNLFQHKESIF